MTKLARPVKSKLYKVFSRNPDMPDMIALTDKVIEEMIRTERMYQLMTSHMQRFKRVISLPADITDKLESNDAQITLYLEKSLSEVGKCLGKLEEVCTKITWKGTNEILTALFAAESDSIYFMALLGLKGQQWWSSEGEKIPNIELERRHLVDLLFYTARD